MDPRLKDALSKMDGEKVSLAEEPRRLRAYLYGDYGAGKTTLAAKLVENKGCLITTDSNWYVILKYPEIAEKIVRYPFEGFSQLQAIAQAHTEGVEPWSTYDTLIWDTAPRGIERVVLNILAIKNNFNDQRDKELQSWTHYGLAKNKLNPTVEALNKCGMNIIYTAHVREPSDNDTKKKKFNIRPNGPEACFDLLAQEVSLLGFMYKENKGGKRLISFEGTLQQSGKSQISTIDERTYPVDDIPELVQKWRNR